MDIPLIEQTKLKAGSLQGKTVLLTGGGGGIGFEAARALLWLGASVILVEINPDSGHQALERLAGLFPDGSCRLAVGDVGDEDFVDILAQRFSRVDVVLNNAAVTPLGPVVEVPIEQWDHSYHVNLRGPVLLAKAFLPGMLKRGQGAFVCVSSTGAQFMGPYETQKAAQVHLANTLEAEVENSGVSVLTIGPGFVPTATALASVPQIAKWMNISEQELQETLAAQTLSVEAAGVSFAAAVALADQYHGQEIGGIQVLMDAGIPYWDAQVSLPDADQVDWEALKKNLNRVQSALAKEFASWQDRNLFERQWLLRTFKKKAGMPIERWLEALEQLQNDVADEQTDRLSLKFLPADQLAVYYDDLHEMGVSYMKNAPKREEYLAIVRGWAADARELAGFLTGS